MQKASDKNESTGPTTRRVSRLTGQPLLEGLVEPGEVRSGRRGSLPNPPIESVDENPVFTTSSVESLGWDNSQAEFRFNSTGSDTAWSGLDSPLYSLEGVITKSPPINQGTTRAGPISVIGEIANEYRHLSDSSDSGTLQYNSRQTSASTMSQGNDSNQSINPAGNNQSITPADGNQLITHHKGKINHAELVLEDDFSQMTVLDEYTLEHIKEYCTKAEKLKSALQEAQVYLQLNDGVEYERLYKEKAVKTKLALLAFIKKAQHYMRGHSESGPARVLSPTQSVTSVDPLREKSLQIRRERVERRTGETVEELSELVAQLREIASITPKTDLEFRNLEERSKNFVKTLETSYSEARTLNDDAVETGLEEHAKELEKALADAKNSRTRVEFHLQNCKSELGIFGQAGFSRLSELKPPVFSGDMNDKMDFYTFRDEYEDYIKTRVLSKADQFKLLQKTCLSGTAKQACANLETVDEIWNYLKETWGNVKILFTNKVEELHKLGKCTGSLVKQREWAVSVKTKLDHLLVLCKTHGIENDLYYSPILQEIQGGLPTRIHEDFRELLMKKQRERKELGMELTRDIVVPALINFMGDVVELLTFEINYDLTSNISKEQSKPVSDKGHVKRNDSQTSGKRTFSQKAKERSPKSVGKNSSQRVNKQNSRFSSPNDPKEVDCVLCKSKHTHVHYCEVFQKAKVRERYELLKKAKVCFRCLRMDSEVNLEDRMSWWSDHEPDCDGQWACKQGGCNPRKDIKQSHFLMCAYHTRLNKSIEVDFIKSLDPSLIASDVRFFFNTTLGAYEMNTTTFETAKIVTVDGQLVNPDIMEPSIFMLENLVVNGTELLLFYDSGCAGASISTKAASVLKSVCVRPGPTFMEVAGGRTIKLDTGDDQFFLDLNEGNAKATITALKMQEITCPFPTWELKEVWEEINSDYKALVPEGESLPTVNKSVGGKAVDIMLGIRYLKYFPKLMHQLPGGLGIYKSKFVSANGNLGILGGPHKAWRHSEDMINILNPRAFLTREAAAWYMHDSSYQTGPAHLPYADDDEESGFFEPEEWMFPPEYVDFFDDDEYFVCENQHCELHSGDDDWTVPLDWDLTGSQYSIKSEERKFNDIQTLGSEAPYRCIRCRNCSDCRKGELLEKASLQEEMEQALIESLITLDTEDKKLSSYLPFIQNPSETLTYSRGLAEKVLEAQLRAIQKNPEMREDVLKSHQKLLDRGHVIAYDDLSDEEKERMNSVTNDGYFIPWRVVYKAGSLSTPCRMVFDASQKTPGGESLNNILAKGQNQLAKVLHVLMRFRNKAAAMASDISMAYNGVKLQPEHYAYQKYLMKDDLIESNPTKVMVVRTLIYGVRPAGNITTAGFRLLADHCKTNYPEHSKGATVLEEDTYMDDVLHSEDDIESCKAVAESLDFTLALGSMSVKAYTFSGESPSPEVSADMTHIGVLGMLWDPYEDELKLDIKDLYFGKARRGKLPDPVKGDFGQALKKNFIRRTVTGKVANVFDPAGLVTPITAKFKLDLHELCKLNLDWDDQIPDEYLERWVKNLEDIQELREISFRRTIIPVDAESTQVELVTSVDASSKIAVTVIHSRVKRKNGLYHVQLYCAKSKLVSTSTIPRAELKAAVMGAVLTHTAKSNFGDQLDSNFLVTDSTIVLYWINQDQRPLHVAIRNGVIEIRRFSFPSQWFHIDTDLNIADLGTRTASVADITRGSEWQSGKRWMSETKEEMPLKTLEDINLTSEERRIASSELKAPDISGVVLSNLKSRVGERYCYSKYLVDPCALSWPKAVRTMAVIYRCLDKMVPSWKKKFSQLQNPGSDSLSDPTTPTSQPDLLQFSAEEINRAERYFFLKATCEVKKFSKEKDWAKVTTMKDGILYYSARILDGQEIPTVGEEMLDLEPLHFVRPVCDRYSPVAYSVMTYSHMKLTHHRNAASTLRESRNIAYVLSGRDLAIEIREACLACRRYRAKLVEVEMGKVHPSRLTVAPVFYYCQVDLFGPYSATCEHNHRSKVEVWGVVFKDPTTSAVAVHAMQGYDTPSFLQAYTRFASRHGHPAKLFIDEGSQLLKACKKMELSLVDITNTLNSKHQVGIDFEACPVGGHNVQGVVERSIKEIKKLFKLMFSGLKMDIVSYETAFAYIANELNNLPICLGSKTDDLDHLDLITPSRLLLGRNNQRSLSGPVTITGPSRLMDQMEAAQKAWWNAWKQEKLVDFIPQPTKWRKTTENIKIGDIVVFLKSGQDVKLGEPLWKYGRVVETEVSRDGLVRVVVIEYKNASEKVFRTTRRSARSVAVIHREGDLELVDELNAAAKMANVFYLLSN